MIIKFNKRKRILIKFNKCGKIWVKEKEMRLNSLFFKKKKSSKIHKISRLWIFIKGKKFQKIIKIIKVN